MAYDTDAFRDAYRAAIRPGYSAWLHGSFVFAYGTAWLVWLSLRLSDVRPLEWLAVPLTLVFFNFGEYAVHRFLGHEKRPIGKLFYRRHTGDHHSFFVETRMRFEQTRDFRVILFPAWLVVVYTLGLVLPAYFAFAQISPNVGALVAGSLTLGYLVYEFFHTTQHLPDEHPLARLPWVRTMRRHHAIHHRRALMTRYNFNLVAPLMDVLFGTLYRGDDPDREFDLMDEPVFLTELRETIARLTRGIEGASLEVRNEANLHASATPEQEPTADEPRDADELDR